MVIAEYMKAIPNKGEFLRARRSQLWAHGMESNSKSAATNGVEASLWLEIASLALIRITGFDDIFTFYDNYIVPRGISPDLEAMLNTQFRANLIVFVGIYSSICHTSSTSLHQISFVKESLFEAHIVVALIPVHTQCIYSKILIDECSLDVSIWLTCLIKVSSWQLETIRLPVIGATLGLL